MKKVLPYLILVLLGAGVFLQALHYEFVWDDLLDDLLTNPNLQTINGESFRNIWKISYWDKYIPVTFSIRALLKSAGGDKFNSTIYHLFSIFLHIVNSILVYLLSKKLFKKMIPSIVAALVFLVHPIQVESVVWVTANEVLISSFFGLLSMIFYFEINRNQHKTNYILAILFYGLSILSRPGLIGIPFILIGYEILVSKEKVKTSILRQIPFFIVMIPGYHYCPVKVYENPCNV